MRMDLPSDLNLIAPDAILSKTKAQNPTQHRTATEREKIRHVAEKFEGMFLGQMLGHMFKGLKTDGLMGGGNWEAIFRDMLTQEYGNLVAKSGGIGLADSIERQLLALNEAK